MKAGIKKWVLVACGLGIAGACLGQGSLTPPGAPTATMKTLQQVEPRTIITNLPYSINASGSYYLTTNLTGVAGFAGITVNASDVTVDLNGFVLTGVFGSLAGIWVSSAQNNIEVRNGTISEWTGHGVDAGNAGNSIFRDLRAYSNGFAQFPGSPGFGLAIGDDSLVQGCVAKVNALGGISVGNGSTVSECSAGNNVGAGISSGFGNTVDGCTVHNNGGNGISSGNGNTVSGCTAHNNSGDGISVGDHCSVSGSTSALNVKDGIRATQACFLRDNTCRQNGLGAGAGIHVTGNDNRIEDNHLWGADRGLDIDGTGNYLANNTVLNNADNYDIAANNQLNLLLCEVPETLDWPCSVKFAGTLTCSQTGTNGITVTADDVTIDLDGHALVGPGSSDSGSGIHQASTLRNLTVQNGKVSGWRGINAAGIYAVGIGASIHDIQAATNKDAFRSGEGALITDCTAVDNDTTGIITGNGSTINDCAANGNGLVGFALGAGSTVNNCSARTNSAGFSVHGEGVTIIGCSAQQNTSDGITASIGCTIVNSSAIENGGYGMNCSSTGIMVKDCTANRNTQAGIRIDDYGLVVGNNCVNNGFGGDASGIHATGSGSRIEGNAVSGNDRGIEVDGIGNFIVRNTATGNVVNYVISISNKVGVIVIAPNSGAINGLTGGAGVGSTDPWANFSF